MSKCVGLLRSFGGKEVIDRSGSFVLMFFSPSERICERQQREERLLGLLRRQEPGTDNVHEVHSEGNKTDFALRKHGLKRTSSAAPQQRKRQKSCTYSIRRVEQIWPARQPQRFEWNWPPGEEEG